MLKGTVIYGVYKRWTMFITWLIIWLVYYLTLVEPSESSSHWPECSCWVWTCNPAPSLSRKVMTVTYIHRVPSAAKIGAFVRLLAIWRGSVMKGIWKDLVTFCLLYTAISLSYRYWMVHDEEVKSSFEKVCVYMNKFSEFIPLSFLLGFYVTQAGTGHTFITVKNILLVSIDEHHHYVLTDPLLTRAVASKSPLPV